MADGNATGLSTGLLTRSLSTNDDDEDDNNSIITDNLHKKAGLPE